MRLVILLPALLLLPACPAQAPSNAPPPGRFYWPTGLAHVDAPGSSEGVLFVANANLDKRYGSGSVVAVPLAEVPGLPAFGAAPSGAAVQLSDLRTTERSAVQVASFAGQLAALPTGDGGVRLFLPTRSEGMRVYALEGALAGSPTLQCAGAPPEGQPQNCLATGVTLTPTEFERDEDGLPRAPSPFGVAVAPRACAAEADCQRVLLDGGTEALGRTCAAGRCVTAEGAPYADVYVTHLTQADSPLGSLTNARGYLVRLESDRFEATADAFLDLGPGAGNSVAPADGWVFVSGRTLNPAPNLLRMVRRDGLTLATGLESAFRVADSRGLALGTGGRRLYLSGRVPDSLVVVSIDDVASAWPTLQVTRSVPLPDGPSELRVIRRPGRGDLVAIVCTGAGAVALYDEDVGDLVGLVTGVGLQPFDLAVDERGGGARLFVSNFGDGRVAVIDIPELGRPHEARLVAHLGQPQVCLSGASAAAACADGGAP